MNVRHAALASAFFLPGCAHVHDAGSLKERQYADRLEGRRVRVIVPDPEGRRHAVTLRSTKFEHPFLIGEVERDEVEVSGTWVEIATLLEGANRRVDVTRAEKVELLDRNGLLITYACSCGVGTFAIFGSILVLIALGSAGGGRRFWRDGRAMLPATLSFERRERPCDSERHSKERDALARRWVATARAEAASVPAFERLSTELGFVGAPANLCAAASASAQDEARHTAIAFARAEHWSGRSWSALPLDAPSRWTSPSRVAIETIVREAWFDGCLEEGTAAETLFAVADRCVDPDEAALHRHIATDEARHAELAWSVVEWAWREGGAPAREALIEAVETGSAETFTPAIEGSDLDWLAAHGDPFGTTVARETRNRVHERAATRIRTLIGS